MAPFYIIAIPYFKTKFSVKSLHIPEAELSSCDPAYSKRHEVEHDHLRIVVQIDVFPFKYLRAFRLDTDEKLSTGVNWDEYLISVWTRIKSVLENVTIKIPLIIALPMVRT